MNKARKVAGIGCIAFGILNILDLGTMVIPTLGIQAVVVGLLFVGGGALLLRPPRPEGEPRLGFSGLLRRLGERGERPARPLDPLLPVRVLKLAERRGGQLTVSAVAMALEVGLDDAQAALDELVRKSAATVEVDLASGVATYRFPEFLAPPPEERN